MHSAEKRDFSSVSAPQSLQEYVWPAHFLWCPQVWFSICCIFSNSPATRFYLYMYSLRLARIDQEMNWLYYLKSTGDILIYSSKYRYQITTGGSRSWNLLCSMPHS